MKTAKYFVAIFSLILLSSFVFAAPPPTIQQGGTITIKQGWNMISSPIVEGVYQKSIPYTQLLSKCDKLDKYGGHYLWSWNATLQKWFNPVTLAPYQGAWIYSNGVCDISTADIGYSTEILNPFPLTMKNGWNMISFDGKFTDYAGTCAGKFQPIQTQGSSSALIVRLNPVTQVWEGAETLDSARSYWILVNGDCQLQKKGTITTTTGVPATTTTNVGATTTTTTVSSGSTTTTTTTTTTTIKHDSCSKALGLGKLIDSAHSSYLTRIWGYQHDIGYSEFYSFVPLFTGRMNFTVVPQTNNDMDLYVYKNPTCSKSEDVVCSALGSGVSSETCIFDVIEDKTYFAEVSSYNYGSYDRLAVAYIYLHVKL
ncbi:MAG: hypothetical protein HY515_03795 [Candidatus Aenigmarchaeota archaeon]|nr:hypothetical protein [Candidatus Aenigmarchaeota archaeon]